VLALRVQANAKSADIVANLLASTGAADTPAQRASAGCSPAPGATGAPADRVLLQRTGERDAQPAAERVSAAAADLEPAAQRCAPAATCSGRTVEPSEYSTGGPRSPSAATLDASVDALPPGHTAGADVSASARAAAAKTPARCSAPGEAPDSAEDGEAAAQVADDSGAAGGPVLHTEGGKLMAAGNGALPAPCSADSTARVHVAASSGAPQQLSPAPPAHSTGGAEAAVLRAADPGPGTVAEGTSAGAVQTEAASAGRGMDDGATDDVLAAEEGVAAPADRADGAALGPGAAAERARCSAPAGGRLATATGQPAAGPPAQEAAGEGSSAAGPAAVGRASRSEPDGAAPSALDMPELARAFERGARASRSVTGRPL